MAGARGVVLAAAVLALAAGPASALPSRWQLQDEGVQCVDPPASPDTYAVTAIGADSVQLPATTPPIAILDSGIAQAPEFAGRIRLGVNVTSGSTPTPDNNGHGTAVASVAAAAAGGVRGVSPTSPLIPIKIMDVRGESTADWVIAGFREAVKRGARVINISAAGPSGPFTADDRRVLTAIEQAVSAGAVVVAPSGNEGGASIDVPASYPHVIAVGATDAANARAPFSNTGKGLDVAAPGDAVITAAPSFICSSGYSLATGTSFSAPAVAGAVALLLGANPKLDASQVAQMIRVGAGFAWNPDLGFGLLNVPAALGVPVPPAQPGEVDDDAHWVRKRPLTLSARTRVKTVAGSVMARFDPADVYRVQLRAGDRLSATLDTSLGVALWSPGTGDYDITQGRRKALVKSAQRKLVKVRVRKGGIYYVAVTPSGASAASTAYKLQLRRAR